MIVGFVGASLVGKSIVSARVADDLGYKLVDFDKIVRDKYKFKMTKKDILTEVNANVDKNCVVDFPSNFISDFSMNEIGTLKFLLKEKGQTIVYQLCPLSNLKLSKDFLIFEYKKLLPSYGLDKSTERQAMSFMKKSLDFDMHSSAHFEIADRTVITLSKPNGKEMSLKEAKSCDYKQVLNGVAHNIVDELTK